MKNLSEIEAAIEELPVVEAHKLADWLSSYLDDSWDRQMHDDLATGKLDRFLAKAELDIKANRVRDLDEVVDNVSSLDR